jgi:beta-glucosidase
LSSPAINKGEPLKVNVTVTNGGDYDGEEVVQLYIRDHAASIIRPVKELKGFQKISLHKGESKTVTFELTGDKLSYLDETGKPVLESGKFSVFVGGNSKDVLEGSFELKKVEL